MILQALLIFLVSWLTLKRWQKRDMYKLWNQLRNNYRTLPFIGHAYLFLGDDEDRMKIFQKLGIAAYATGGLLSMWQGSRLYVNISDPAIAEIVMKTFLEKDDVMKCSRLLTGNGSVFAPVSIWRPRRKFLAPTFSPKNLLQFAEIFSRQSSVMVDQLKTKMGKGSFSLWKYITTYSMDSVCESTLGVRVDTQLQPSHPFLKAFEEVLKIDSARICQPWLHNDTLFKMTPTYKVHTEHRTTIRGFIDRIIKSKRLAIERGKKYEPENAESEQCTETKPKTFLELLIDSTGGERGFSDLELQEETLVLVLAGTDTTAVGTAFTALMLARHPEVQEKVYQEIKDIFGDTDRPVTVEDLPRLKYLDAVIRETLRLFPSVPIIVRKVTHDLTLPSGITLVKDCGIVVNIWAIHRNPKYWGDDAMEFRPERFLEAPLKHPAAFMAFSHGPRGCIGIVNIIMNFFKSVQSNEESSYIIMQKSEVGIDIPGYRYAMMSMKTAVSTLVRQFRLHNAEGAAHAPVRVKFDVMLKHVDNFKLQLEARRR